jgi:hypothetical protein
MNMFKRIFSAIRIAGGVLRLWWEQPVILTPFLVLMVCHALVLCVLFLAPRPPISSVLAPVIRAFAGEQFLHYPENFLLLPRLFTYGKNISDFFVGVFFTCVAITLIHQGYQKTTASWWFGVKKAVRRFPRALVIWGCTFGAAVLVVRLTSRYIGPLIPSVTARIMAEFSLSILVQMIFVFALPSVIIENRKAFAALRRSLQVLGGRPIETILLVALPSLAFIPVIYGSMHVPQLMQRFFPEVTLYVLAGRIFIGGMVDLSIVSGVTLLFLAHKDSENGQPVLAPEAVQ